MNLLLLLSLQSVVSRAAFATRTPTVRRSIATQARKMTGYDPAFLGPGNEIPLPSFSEELLPDVLSANEMPETEFQDDYYTNYIHYSTATNTVKRQPIVVALNINQDLLKAVSRGRWKLDDQVGDYQLDNSYYRRNDYDRGHLARRASSAWGETEEEALEASEDTMYYSNACLQHAGFNQDEWLALESWVLELELDSTDKVSSFSGPIYTSRRGITKSIGNPPAQIPTAFFKVVCFVDHDETLQTRAFIMAQDHDAISDKNAKNKRLDLGTYQVPIEVIEEETGLIFPDVVRNGNPLGGIEHTEDDIVPVNGAKDTLKSKTETKNRKNRTKIKHLGVFVLGAMVDPEGRDDGQEWITISNFGRDDLNLTGWSVSDGKRNPVEIDGVIPVGEARRINNIQGLRFTNTKGSIALIDPEGNIVDRVMYSERSHKIRTNVPIMFHLNYEERETGMS